MFGIADDVSELLSAWSGGDESARDRLMPAVYDELRRVAHRHMRAERSDHTLQTTDLVHEVYLRLAGQHSTDWKTRAQFFAIAATMMRRILVDHARRRASGKGGGGMIRLQLAEAFAAAEVRSAEVVAVDEALDRFAVTDPRAARIVELRYFAGLTLEQVAELLDLSIATVKRDWTAAKTWLARELRTER
jgi:RNA polymerase sigma factor (TIGR02999 family)